MPELVFERRGRTIDQVSNQVIYLLVQLGEIRGERTQVLSAYIGGNPARGIINRRDSFWAGINPIYAWIEETEDGYEVSFGTVNPDNANKIYKTLSRS